MTCLLPASPQQRLRQTTGANPIQSTLICWEMQHCQWVRRDWAIWGVFVPTKPPLMHWSDGPERKKAKDTGRTATRRGFSSEKQETSVHFQSFESKRPSCRDASWSIDTRWTWLNQKIQQNWAAGLAPKRSCHRCSYNQRSVTETSCASHRFRFWVTVTQLLYKVGGETTNQNKTKRWDYGLSNLSDNFLTSGRNTGSIKAARSSLCVPILSGFFVWRTAVWAWQLHTAAGKPSRKLFCKVATSGGGAVVIEQLSLILKGYKNTAVQFVLWGEDA